MTILLPQVITAGGTARFVFDLADAKQERLSNVAAGTATVSLRKTTTPRTEHELTHLPAVLDPVAATVTLRLTVAQVEALAPSIAETDRRQQMDVVSDVRIVQGAEINYFGPFTFAVRLPETYEGQPIPTPTVTLRSLMIIAITETTATVTVGVVNPDGVSPIYLRYQDHRLRLTLGPLWKQSPTPRLQSLFSTTSPPVGRIRLEPHSSPISPPGPYRQDSTLPPSRRLLRSTR